MYSIKLRCVIDVGDKVRIGRSDAVVFVVREIDSTEGRALIEAEQDAPGRYPFSMPLTALVLAELEPPG